MKERNLNPSHRPNVKETSSGTSARARPAAAREPVSILRVVLVTLALLILLLSQARRLQEHWLYFTEDRQPATFTFQELSGRWSEKTLYEKFPGYPIRCQAYDGDLPADRACAVDTASHNGMPTLFISFFFARGHLSDVSINVPWWLHGTAHRQIVTAFGLPHGSQMFPRHGVRLHGWQLPGGAALFLNRDRSWNPLEWSAIYWRSAESCAMYSCFTDPKSHSAGAQQR